MTPTSPVGSHSTCASCISDSMRDGISPQDCSSSRWKHSFRACRVLGQKQMLKTYLLTRTFFTLTLPPPPSQREFSHSVHLHCHHPVHAVTIFGLDPQHSFLTDHQLATWQPGKIFLNADFIMSLPSLDHFKIEFHNQGGAMDIIQGEKEGENPSLFC